MQKDTPGTGLTLHHVLRYVRALTLKSTTHTVILVRIIQSINVFVCLVKFRI